MSGKTQQVSELWRFRRWEIGYRRFFQDQVRIRAPETKGADAGQSPILKRLPRRWRLYEIKYARLFRKIRVQLLEVQIRRNLLMLEREHGLNKTGNASGCFKMADVGFDRAQQAAARVS
jgi:hypothetical protein